MNWVDQFNKWLNDHPYWKGLLTAVEGALSGALVDALANPNVFTKAGTRQTLVTVGGAIVIAMRNYFKTAPRKEWTSLERAEKTGGSNVVAQTTTVTVDKSATSPDTPPAGM